MHDHSNYVICIISKNCRVRKLIKSTDVLGVNFRHVLKIDEMNAHGNTEEHNLYILFEKRVYSIGYVVAFIEILSYKSHIFQIW